MRHKNILTNNQLAISFKIRFQKHILKNRNWFSSQIHPRLNNWPVEKCYKNNIIAIKLEKKYKI